VGWGPNVATRAFTLPAFKHRPTVKRRDAAHPALRRKAVTVDGEFISLCFEARKDKMTTTSKPRLTRRLSSMSPDPEHRLIFRKHALNRMFERAISEEDVRRVLTTGEVIQHYPHDAPYPSRLLLGWCGQRPIHVVAADIGDERATVIITVYEPDLQIWEADFKRKKQP
jgi:hypothetical protein